MKTIEGIITATVIVWFFLIILSFYLFGEYDQKRFLQKMNLHTQEQLKK